MNILIRDAFQHSSSEKWSEAPCTVLSEGDFFFLDDVLSLPRPNRQKNFFKHQRPATLGKVKNVQKNGNKKIIFF